jgi:hypothetical protein
MFIAPDDWVTWQVRLIIDSLAGLSVESKGRLESSSSLVQLWVF